MVLLLSLCSLTSILEGYSPDLALNLPAIFLTCSVIAISIGFIVRVTVPPPFLALSGLMLCCSFSLVFLAAHHYSKGSPPVFMLVVLALIIRATIHLHLDPELQEEANTTF